MPNSARNSPTPVNIVCCTRPRRSTNARGQCELVTGRSTAKTNVDATRPGGKFVADSGKANRCGRKHIHACTNDEILAKNKCKRCLTVAVLRDRGRLSSVPNELSTSAAGKLTDTYPYLVTFRKTCRLIFQSDFYPQTTAAGRPPIPRKRASRSVTDGRRGGAQSPSAMGHHCTSTKIPYSA